MRRGWALLMLVAWAAAQEEGAYTDFERGLRLYQAKDYARAEPCFKAATADPKCRDAHYYLGLLLERKGDAAGAAAHYGQVTDAYPTFAFAQDRLGEMARSKGDLKGAAGFFETACKARPVFDGWLKLGLLRIETSEYTAAEEAFTKAKELSPGDLTLQDAFARLYLETERFEEALACSEAIVKAVPRDASARFLKGVCLERLVRIPEATAAYEETLKVDPAHKGAMQRLVKLYAQDPAKARETDEMRKRLDWIEKHPPKVRPAPPQ